jgi:hypothetical protein
LRCGARRRRATLEKQKYKATAGPSGLSANNADFRMTT